MLGSEIVFFSLDEMALARILKDDEPDHSRPGVCAALNAALAEDHGWVDCSVCAGEGLHAFWDEELRRWESRVCRRCGDRYGWYEYR